MASRGVKRSSSKAAGGVAKQCRVIAKAIKQANDVPAPVRAMLRDTIAATFSTYKEERHPFQKQVSELVGKVMKETQKKLQGAISQAQQKKAALEAEAAGLSRTNDGAVGGSDAAGAALTAARTAVTDSKQALRDAKTALHDLESAVKTSEAEAKAATERQANLAALATDFVTPIREGARHGVGAGKHVARVIGSSVDPEFLVAVERTFSKAASTWGTFDHIVDKKFEEAYKRAVANVAAELQQNAAAKEARTAQIENQKGALAAAEDRVNQAEQACGQAASAATDAQGGAKTTTGTLKAKQVEIEKQAAACTAAENELAAFNKGAFAAFSEVEARTAPPPEPEKPQAAPAVEQVMQAAPAAGAAASQMLPSPSVLLSRAAQAVGLAPSPRVAASPRAVQSPRGN